MIIIKTVCQNCGEILIRSLDIHLHLTKEHKNDYYEFECPKCGKKGSGEADKEFIKILIENGVKPHEEVIIERHHGKPLTWDDYLDFKLALKSSKIYEELAIISKSMGKQCSH